MNASIRPNRLDISARFPLASFTITTDGKPRLAEIVVATDPRLFSTKEGRTKSTFYSSREQGMLSLPRAEAVYTLPPEVLARFTDADKLWFGLATTPAENGDRNWHVDLLPSESSPYISLAGLTDSSLRRVRMFPRRTARSNYGNSVDVRLEWAGDAAQPGMDEAGQQAPQAANGQAPGNGADTATAPNGVAATPPNGAPADVPYDDGFGPMPSTDETANGNGNGAVNGTGNGAANGNGNGEVAAEGQAYGYSVSDAEADRLDDQGIDGPVVDEAPPSQAHAMEGRPRALRQAEYDGVTKIMPSPNYSNGRRGQTIDRVVIHITDAGQTPYIGTWFTREAARASSHYMVDQNGDIIQFVREQDTAWHAGNRTANRRSIGIEHVAVKRGGATYGSTTYPHTPPSDAEYRASAALVAHLCRKYNLTPDRTTIVGHNEINANTSHSSCPTGAWDWDTYMPLVAEAYAALGRVGGIGSGQAYANGHYGQPPALMMGGGFDGRRALNWIREKIEQAVDVAGSDVSPPSVLTLTASQSETFTDAWRIAFILNPGMAILPSLATETGVTLSIGPVLETPFFGGGIGVVFDPNGQVGLFSQGDIDLDLSGIAEFARSLKAVLHGSVKLGYNSGGIAGFKSVRKSAEVTVGEEIVVGAELWLNGQGRGIGGAASIGVGFALQFAAQQSSAFGAREPASVTLSGGWTAQRVVAAIERAMRDGVRAAASDVNPPSVYRLSDEMSTAFIVAWKAAYSLTMPAFSQLPNLAETSGKTVSVGPILETPLFGAGVGVLFTPDGKVGLFGRGDLDLDVSGVAEFISSLRAVLTAGMKIGINNGGISGFEQIRKAASVSGGGEIVVGAEVWLNGSDQIIGGAVKAGVGFAVQFSAERGQALEPPEPVMAQELGTRSRAQRAIDAIERAILEATRAVASDVNPPRVHILGSWLSRAFRTAFEAASRIALPAYSGLPDLAKATGKTISVGPTLNTPLFGAGVGVIFEPSGRVGIFGRGDLELDFSGIASFITSLKAILAASVKVGINDGGIDGFKRIRKAASLSGGAEIVVGAEVWLDASENVIGGAVKVGIGFAMQFAADARSHAMTADSEQLVEHAKKIGGPFHVRINEAMNRGYPKANIASLLDTLDPQAASVPATGQAYSGSLGISQTINWDEVDLVPQPTDQSCWATAGAILYGWMNKQSVSPETIADFAGKTVGDYLTSNKLQKFADDVGLSYDYGQSYTPEGFFQRLEEVGPLFVMKVPQGVTSNPDILHCVVVTGMYNYGGQWMVRVTDPWDRDAGTPGAPGGYAPTHSTGSRYILKYEDFVGEYESAAGVSDLQVLHANGHHGHVPNRGPNKPEVYAQSTNGEKPMDVKPEMQPANGSPANGAAPPPLLNGEPVAEHGFGPQVTITRQQLDKGERHYDLAQMRGFAMPQTGAMVEADAMRAEPVLLNEWPYIDGPNGRTQAGIAIDWAHKGGAVGQVGITPLDGQSPDGWHVSVRADLAKGPDMPGKAQVLVRVTTTFSKQGEQDQVAASEVTLAGDGRANVQHDVGGSASPQAPTLEPGAPQPAPAQPAQPAPDQPVPSQPAPEPVSA